MLGLRDGSTLAIPAGSSRCCCLKSFLSRAGAAVAAASGAQHSPLHGACRHARQRVAAATCAVGRRSASHQALRRERGPVVAIGVSAALYTSLVFVRAFDRELLLIDLLPHDFLSPRYALFVGPIEKGFAAMTRDFIELLKAQRN